MRYISKIIVPLDRFKHAKYLKFLKVIFKCLLKANSTKIIHLVGIKLIINGRLKGKPRAKRYAISMGKIANQTFSSMIEFNKVDAHTKYGCFGFKFWIHYYE